MSKTKTMRVDISDAEKIEQAARELGACMGRDVKIKEVIKELLKELDNAKRNIKERNKI